MSTDPVQQKLAQYRKLYKKQDLSVNHNTLNYKEI